MNYKKESIALHEKLRGKLGVVSKVSLETKDDLSLAYTPGVGGVSQYIADNPEAVYTHTIKGNTVAIVTDGSAVLGLGNIGPEAALAVMEGKALLLKEFADVDAFPICLDTQDTEEIIKTVRLIAPGFGGINLEDISAPRCFEIEERLQDLGIPVFHDDQHGTAIVAFAALINAVKVVGKTLDECTVVINGAGAAGVAIARMLDGLVEDIIMCDSKGIIHKNRSDLNPIKESLLDFVNTNSKEGTLQDACEGSDIFIGVSVAGALSPEMVKSMALDAIILAMANPDPEIMPDEAKRAGARIIATGRSDFPNQVNNVLAFPGIFRGALDARAPVITQEMKRATAQVLADCVEDPHEENILPSALDKDIAPKVAEAVKAAYNEET